MNNHVTTGVIKEKTSARRDYEKGLEKGKSMAYSKINESTPNVMQIEIGNIPAKTEVTIIYSFNIKMKIAQNKFWQLLIPS